MTTDQVIPINCDFEHVFSIAYFCNNFFPSASTHVRVQEKHQEKSLRDRQRWGFGQ